MDLDDLENMVDDWDRSAQRQLAGFQAMGEQVQQLSARGEAEQGAVVVTVGPNGIPTDVSMTAKVRQLSPEQIAAAVLTAMRAAQAEYSRRLGEIMAETVGPDDPVTRHVVAEAQKTFPAPEPEAAPPPATEPEDPDDFSGNSWLEKDR
ncbi:YbaB/EbfC family DNA-binding protein [Pseudonocardiaceae bacterium YIM PH 21723]|nr:YbaB/EbfC family DNA-binding protein [Pseudonocardiaceae bacterium YIM PH 21723]